MPILMTKQRYEELFYYWEHETSNLCTMDWRDQLLPSERMIVDSWDKAFSLGAKDLIDQFVQLREDIHSRWHKVYLPDPDAETT